ncbi:ABC transporter substrate-binding protein [Microbacterium sp. E-13]|uniref:ABC transporter substrate-binding protein n=1 Tax=Microbacterium sp. E-13 TaxID=3404048 RepID=UPI003CF82137
MNTAAGIRRAALIIGAASLAMSLAACTSDDPVVGAAAADAGATEDLTPVTVGAVYTTAAVPLWIADEQGIFEEHGLDVTITQSPNFAASAPALLNGQMQFANAATAPIITAIDKDMPIQIVAGVQAEPADPTRGDDQVMVVEGSDITRPADLEGKTVAINAVGSGPYVGIMANYLEDGGAPDGINWVVMNLNEQIPALEAGQVDAIVASEPFRAAAADAGFATAFNAYRAPGIDVIPAEFSDAVVVASSKYLAENAEVAEAMREALIEANDFAEGNPDAVRDLLVKKLELAPEVADAIYLPGFRGEVEPGDVQAMIDAMLQMGLITNEQDATELVWMP